MLNRPESCSGCPLNRIATGFSHPTGTGALGVLVVAEALGEHEAREGRPLVEYAQAGSLFQYAIDRIGVDREQLALWNIVACFSSWKTSVFTPSGYKRMDLIELGDKVLTHRGRFQRVVGKPRQRPMDGTLLTIKIATVTRPVELNVTTDHRFLVEGEWMYAKDLRVGMPVQVMGERCLMCDKLFFRYFSHQYRSLPFCSTRCHNIDSAHKGREKILEVMLESYRTGKRDAKQITKAANAAMREMLKAGWRVRRDDETVAKTRLSSALTRQAMGLIDNVPWIGHGERDVADILESAGYEFVPQFALEGYNFDFKVGDVLVEVDGEGAKRNGARPPIQAKKDALAASRGYSVVHLDYDKPGDVLNLLDNDNHNYEFLDTNVVDISARASWKPTYSLTVENDESYVAMGAVNHNCRPPGNRLENMTYERGAAEHCREAHFNGVVERFRPKVMLAMGNTALKHLTGMTGKNRTVSSLRGYVLKSLHWPGVVVVPTYHPSFLRRGASNLLKVFMGDISRAIDVAQGANNYIINPTIPDGFVLAPRESDLRDLIEWLRANPQALLSYDIETDMSIKEDESSLFKLEEEEDGEVEPEEAATDEMDKFVENATKGSIVQIQFSHGVGHAISVPWADRYIPGIREILASPNPKVSQNGWKFDLPLLKLAGMKLGGTQSDTLWAWHHANPDLPAHLQFIASFFGQPFPWKHMAGQDLAFYGAVDVEVLHRIWAELPGRMERLRCQ